MKIRGKSSDKNEKIELQMTPMIDIVFQLLVFFIMTFNVVAQEGDFTIRMPAIGAPQDELEDIEKQTLKVRMQADAAGNLKELKLDDAVLGGDTLSAKFANLHNKILSKVQDAGGPVGIALRHSNDRRDTDGQGGSTNLSCCIKIHS